MAAHSQATFWYVLPSLPMFLVIPALLRHGASFWLALLAGCGLTVALYALMTWIGPRFGLQLKPSCLGRERSAGVGSWPVSQPPPSRTTAARARPVLASAHLPHGT